MPSPDHIAVEATKRVALTELAPYPGNARRGDVAAIAASLKAHGQYKPLIVNKRTGQVLAGNHTLLALRDLGAEKALCSFVDVDEIEAKRIVLVDNRTTDLAAYDDRALADLLGSLPALEGTAFDGEAHAMLLRELDRPAPDPTVVARALADDYLVPPFTILDTRQGYWRDRVDEWMTLGIASELGRDNGLACGERTNPDFAIPSDGGRITTVSPVGTVSIFDPVLCEIAYRWFCPPAGVVVDPFAGGSVRGIVAASLGHPYVGVELRGEQVDANRQQARDIFNVRRLAGSDEPVHIPTWIQGDSRQVLADSGDVPRADMILTCPPYGDLERYSDDPADISAMGADEFDDAYRDILRLATGRLVDDRFAVIVIGNVRDKKGRLRDLVGLTIRAMGEAGADYYNEAILLNAVGTGAIRARKQMDTSRKLVRLHQQVLVFVKGSAKAATLAVGPVLAPDDYALAANEGVADGDTGNDA